MKFPVRSLSVAIISLAPITIAQPNSLFAQTGGHTPVQPMGDPMPAGWGIGGTFVLGPGIGSLAIAGQPFSAVEESEHSQLLADGTHVVQTSQTHIYRDSQGRTRSEHTPLQPPAPRRAPVFASINDPVARVHYTLDIKRQIAHRFEMHAPGENHLRATSSPPQMTIQTPAQAAPSSASTSMETAEEPVHQKVSRVSLGKQNIEGIETEGVQITTTIPVGAKGNDRPLVIVCEDWRSQELKVVMLSKCTDPLRGDRTVRVVSIDRTEPDPSLFQVPADFTIVDPQNRQDSASTTSTEQ